MKSSEKTREYLTSVHQELLKQYQEITRPGNFYPGIEEVLRMRLTFLETGLLQFPPEEPSDK